MIMNWFIGIDGGGTKTVGYAADYTGKCLARVEKGPSNYHTAGLVNFKAVIADIVDELSITCRLSKADLSIISLGLAGVDRVRDREITLSALAELGLDCHYIVNSDAKAALVAGLGRAEGIVLIAGTGSVAYGINKKGEVTRAGGWGHLASDEGSGYAIGRQALVRGIQAAEQRDRKTVLVPMMIKHLRLKSWDEMIGCINSRETTKADIASLAQVVAAAAQEGDDVAAEILIKAGDDLAELVKSVMTRGFGAEEQVQVCLYGSIVRNIALVHKRLAAVLAGTGTLVASDKEPATGAILLGLEWIRQKEWENCN
jgi:N-acetylglucosamine kinase-like BadF-type ATPase